MFSNCHLLMVYFPPHFFADNSYYVHHIFSVKILCTHGKLFEKCKAYGYIATVE